MQIPMPNMTTPPTAPIPIKRGSVNKQYQNSVKSNHKVNMVGYGNEAL